MDVRIGPHRFNKATYVVRRDALILKVNDRPTVARADNLDAPPMWLWDHDCGTQVNALVLSDIRRRSVGDELEIELPSGAQFRLIGVGQIVAEAEQFELPDSSPELLEPVRIGPYRFDHVVYNSDTDILYAGFSDARGGVGDGDTSEYHVWMTDDDGRVVELIAMDVRAKIAADGGFYVTLLSGGRVRSEDVERTVADRP